MIHHDITPMSAVMDRVDLQISNEPKTALHAVGDITPGVRDYASSHEIL